MAATEISFSEVACQGAAEYKVTAIFLTFLLCLTVHMVTWMQMAKHVTGFKHHPKFLQRHLSNLFAKGLQGIVMMPINFYMCILIVQDRDAILTNPGRVQASVLIHCVFHHL